MATLDPNRYPDLTGKAVIAVGADHSLVEVTRLLAVNAMLIAVVSQQRDLVHQCIEVAESLGAMVNGFTVDPADRAVWQRIAPHIEQRLGPIDVVICGGGREVHDVVVSALAPDMAARHRGVIVAIGATEPVATLSDGVRHLAVAATLSAAEIAAVAVRHASDTVTP